MGLRTLEIFFIGGEGCPLCMTKGTLQSLNHLEQFLLFPFLSGKMRKTKSKAEKEPWPRLALLRRGQPRQLRPRCGVGAALTAGEAATLMVTRQPRGAAEYGAGGRPPLSLASLSVLAECRRTPHSPQSSGLREPLQVGGGVSLALGVQGIQA